MAAPLAVGPAPVAVAPTPAGGANGPAAPNGEKTTMGKAFRIAMGVVNSVLCMLCFTPLAEADMWSNFYWSYKEIKGDRLQVALAWASLFISMFLGLYTIVTIVASLLTAIALVLDKKGLYFAVLGVRAFELFCSFVMYITLFGVCGAIMSFDEKVNLEVFERTGDFISGKNIVYGSFAAGPITWILLGVSIGFAVMLARELKKSTTPSAGPVVAAAPMAAAPMGAAPVAVVQ